MLAAVDGLLGDETAARGHAEGAIEVAARVGTAWLGALAEHELGRLAAGRRDWSQAERLLHDALAALVDGGHRLHIPDSLEALAEVAGGLESYAEAARLLAAAERARPELGIVRWAPEHEHFQTLVHQLRAALGDEAYDAADLEGQALSMDDAVRYLHQLGVRNRAELTAYASRRDNRQRQEDTRGKPVARGELGAKGASPALGLGCRRALRGVCRGRSARRRRPFGGSGSAPGCAR
jgi:hypothetical protein